MQWYPERDFIIKYVTAHSIIELPISDASLGACLPLLVLQNGEISAYAAAWARGRLIEGGAGPAGLRLGVRSIGLFYDFYVLVLGSPTTHARSFRQLIVKFYEARRYGNAVLGWKPVRQKTAADDVYVVSVFSDWCAENFGHFSINPTEKKLFSDLTAREKVNELTKQKYKDESNKLLHWKPATQTGKGVVVQRIFNPRKSNKKTGPKSFPSESIEIFLAKIPSIRDKLYFLLLFFSGLRISEPAHLFCTDIRIELDGGATVILGHPEDGAYEWYDREKRHRRGSRATFLREEYQMGPRSAIGSTHPLFSGWKGRVHSDGNRCESEVNWLREDVRFIFAQLHSQYMRETRRFVKDTHPYYFVNQYGAPCTLKSMHNAFLAAVSRIGLSTRQAGVNSHGPRHYYGYYCASVLRLSIEVTQKLMGHEDLGSTKVYYRISDRVVHTELAAARRIADAGGPPLIIAPPSP